VRNVIFLVVCSFYLPFHVFAIEIYNNDFNDGSWGNMVHGSFWTLQNTGGVGNSKAIRLQYSEAGTANKWAAIDLASAHSQEYWVELDVKMEGKCSGGSKFIKFFGHNSIPTQNNMTLAMDYNSCKQRGIGYYLDCNCTANYDGNGYCGAAFNSSSSDIDMSGGSWGHYKVHVKRADPGKVNGTLQVWWNGVLKADIYNLDSNPSSGATDFIGYVEFGGYNHALNFSGSTWYLWMDNIYVGTTEKGGGSQPKPTTPPADPASPPLAPADFKSAQN
jgi:hypothetical protein